MKDDDALNLLGTEIYDRLLSDIVSQKLAPDSRIVVDKLARDYCVSQTPIRQAMARLQAEDLVVSKHNAGFRVSPLPSKDWFLNSLEYRLIVEPAAAKIASQNMTAAQENELRNVLEQLENCKSGDAETYGKFSAIDAVFHGLIAQFSGNEVIAGSLSNVRRKMIAFRMTFPDDLRLSLQAEHHTIFNALSNRDPEAAFEAMHAHISSTIKWVSEA